MIGSFQSLIDRLPYDEDRLVGMAISFFINEQKPEQVKFDVYIDEDDEPYAYAIKIKTDKDKIREASEFWEEYVEPEL